MHLEVCLIVSEVKDTLTGSDLLTAEHFFERVETLDAEFKQYHHTVIHPVGNEEKILDEEQATMDNQEDKVGVITECLYQFQPVSKAASLVAQSMSHSNHLQKRPNHLERITCSVKDEIKGLTLRPDLDSCLLLQLEEQVSSIKLDVAEVTQDNVSPEKKEEDL